MIDAAAIKAISDIAQQAQAAQMIYPAGCHTHVGVRVGSTIDWREIPPPKRAYTIASLVDLVALVTDKAICPAPEVFHSDDAVRIVLDRGSRREIATMALTRTKRFEKVKGLDPDDAISPKAAVKLVRYDLHGLGSQVDALIATLGKIDFTRNGANRADVAHGRESLGRSVEAAVQQADKVPDRFKATVPVFHNGGLRGVKVDVLCGVYLDMEAEGICIYPLADEIESALESAQSQLHVLLAEKLPGVPIFNGVPTLAP